MFLPILLSLSLLVTGNTVQVKNKLKKCPSTEEIFSQLNINRDTCEFTEELFDTIKMTDGITKKQNIPVLDILTDINSAQETIALSILRKESSEDIKKALKILSTKENPLTEEWLLSYLNIDLHDEKAVESFWDQVNTIAEEKRKLLYELVYRIDGKKVLDYEPCDDEWEENSYSVD